MTPEWRDLERFYSQASEVGECWEWPNTTIRRTYGCFHFAGRKWLPHRFAWMAMHGAIPDGMFVCHRCDNPRCIRTDHLFLGSPADNMADMKNKGRGRVRYGENRADSKLTVAQVKEIRGKRGMVSQSKLAREFGVCQQMISRIQLGLGWPQSFNGGEATP